MAGCFGRYNTLYNNLMAKTKDNKFFSVDRLIDHVKVYRIEYTDHAYKDSIIINNPKVEFTKTSIKTKLLDSTSIVSTFKNPHVDYYGKVNEELGRKEVIVTVSVETCNVIILHFTGDDNSMIDLMGLYVDYRRK